MLPLGRRVVSELANARARCTSSLAANPFLLPGDRFLALTAGQTPCPPCSPQLFIEFDPALVKRAEQIQRLDEHLTKWPLVLSHADICIGPPSVPS